MERARFFERRRFFERLPERVPWAIREVRGMTLLPRSNRCLN